MVVSRENHSGVNLASKKIKYFKTPIIGGKYRGKMIEIPAISTTRSSKSILRESLFNTIAFDLYEANFVELFAGSGSIGLEALSRGAKHSYFIEKNRTALRLLRDNIENIDKESATLLFGDTFELFSGLYQQLQNEAEPTFFYLDPPFSIREGMEDIYKKSLELMESINDSFVQMVIVEHMSDIEMPKSVGKLHKTKEKRFGKSTLSYYQLEQ